MGLFTKIEALHTGQYNSFPQQRYKC